jgi:hypothetical protein
MPVQRAGVARTSVLELVSVRTAIEDGAVGKLIIGVHLRAAARCSSLRPKYD